MRRFNFNLQKLLRLRKYQEDMQQATTLAQEEKVRELLAQRNDMLQENDSVRQELIPDRGSRWPARNQHQHYRYHLWLNHNMLQLDQELLQESVKLQQERSKLVEESRRRKTLERLRERRFDSWQQEANHEEGKILDEVASINRSRQKGSVFVTTLLLALALGVGWLCAATWLKWARTGSVETPYVRAPFDYLAQKQIREQINAYDYQQQLKRERLDAMRDRQPAAPEALIVPEHEGYDLTMQRIRRKEESLRRKELELDSREVALQQAERDLRNELTRLNNIQQRVSQELDELRAIEAKRTEEMTAERIEKLDRLAESVKAQTAKRAASLLLAVAFPDPQDPLLPAFPVGESFEGPELVIELLMQMPDRNRAEILDAMVKSSAEKTAILFDMMDNVRTGLEPDL